MRHLAKLPLAVLQLLGACGGVLVFLLSPRYRRCLLENTALYAEHQPGCQRLSWLALQGLRFSAILQAGAGMLDMAAIWFSKRCLQHQVEYRGWEQVQPLIDVGHGVIFFTPHLGGFEMAARAIAMRHPIAVLYRPHRKPAVQALLVEAREQGNVAALRPGAIQTAPASLGGVRQLLRVLKAGGLVGMLPDQVPQAGEGLWVDFWGRPAFTMTLPAKLHHMTGAPMVAVLARRRPWGLGFRVEFMVMRQTLPTDLGLATEQVTRWVEDLIRQEPSQYLWGYNRYKMPRSQGTGSTKPSSHTSSPAR